jgi:hypothetical protein
VAACSAFSGRPDPVEGLGGMVPLTRPLVITRLALRTRPRRPGAWALVIMLVSAAADIVPHCCAMAAAAAAVFEAVPQGHDKGGMGEAGISQAQRPDGSQLAAAYERRFLWEADCVGRTACFGGTYFLSVPSSSMPLNYPSRWARGIHRRQAAVAAGRLATAPAGHRLLHTRRRGERMHACRHPCQH